MADEQWVRIKAGQYQRGDLVWAHVERGDASGWWWWCTCAGRGGRRQTLREAKAAADTALDNMDKAHRRIYGSGQGLAVLEGGSENGE